MLQRIVVIVVALTAQWLVMPIARASDGPGGRAAAAQGTGQPSGAGPSNSASPDFFLGQPRGWVAIRGGILVPRAGGELFAFVGEQLTLSPADFRSGTLNLELGFLLTPQLSIEGGFDLTKRRVDSEYRNFVTTAREPITQSTALNQTGFSVGLRFTPSGHGKRITRIAFVPRRLTPYAGGGLQFTYYDFLQRGNFVDFQDLSIFPDVFRSSGWTVGPFVRGGVDLQVWRRVYVNGDLRFSWLRSDLSRDFMGFDGIDLAGIRGATGISVKF